ncbi:MAG: ABC transporter permease, partial [Comamonas sp.]
MSQAPVNSSAAATDAGRVQSIWAQIAHDFLRSKPAIIGLVILLIVAVVLILAALVAPWITPQNPYDLQQLDVLDARLPPGSANGLASFHYMLGTDGQGRDLYSAILYGLRISLVVGVGSALIAGVVGTLLGLLAAYAGGKTDTVIMRVVDLILSFPS